MSARNSLGKGLDALMPKEFDQTILSSPDEKIKKIRITEIVANPDQPRKQFDQESLNELAQSIKNHGIVQPLVVTREGDKYRIIAGERRFRAAKIAEITELPAIVRSLKTLEELEIAIIENVQRVDLSSLEQALSIERLRDQFSLSYTEIANKLGKAVPTINNSVRLLQLPENAKIALNNNQISEGHARAILALKDLPDLQKELLESILKFNWSVRQAEQFVNAAKNQKTAKKSVQKHMQTSTPQTEALAKQLSTNVSIKRTAKGGKLEIFFKDDSDLDRIVKIVS